MHNVAIRLVYIRMCEMQTFIESDNSTGPESCVDMIGIYRTL